MCGEKCVVSCHMASRLGLPPRVRGKGNSDTTQEQDFGVTPASAGKNRATSSLYSGSGLLPRVRGKVIIPPHLARGRGITPASAGNHSSLVISPPVCRDYPRICGEKCVVSCHMASPLGLSPRVRGKESLDSVDGVGVGITPACAGKRPSHPHYQPTHWDHPRVCGEKMKEAAKSALDKGSPPRARGKAGQFAGLRVLLGITPACAGKSPASGSRPGRSGDHPRVCGEKWSIAWRVHDAQGSPPRVRGKAHDTGPHSQGMGITPACAGNHQSDCFTLTTVSIPSPYALPRPRPFTRTWRNSSGSVTVRLPS